MASRYLTWANWYCCCSLFAACFLLLLIIDGFFFVSFSSILTPVKIKINPQFPHNNIRKSFMLSLSSSLSISLISPVFLRLLAWWRIVALCGSSYGKFCSGEWSSSRSSYPRERHTMPRCRIEVAFCFFGGDAPKEARPQSSGMSNSFFLIAFPPKRNLFTE